MRGSLAILASCSAVLGLLKWFQLDMAFDRRLSQEQANLGAEGKWNELNDFFEKRLRLRRPLLRIFRACVSPGQIEAQYALHLSEQGRNEEALQVVNRAVQKSRRHKECCGMARVARALIFHRLGRYDEAKAEADATRGLLQHYPGGDLINGVVAHSTGEFATVLSLGRELMDTPAVRDVARALVSATFVLQHRFQEALDVLTYKPANVIDFFTPKGLQAMTADHIGERLVLTMDSEVAAVFRPAQHLQIADVFLEAGDRTAAEQALGRAAREMKAHPAVRRLYEGLCAVSCAIGGDASGTEEHLSRARKMAGKFPSRSALYETNLVAGRCYLTLGKSQSAIAELRSALKLALHPLEKHSTSYWLGRALEAAGDRTTATLMYAKVVADQFDTWTSADARART